MIFEIPSNIRFTFEPFFITKGPVFELSIVIEFKVIVGEVSFFISIPHSEQDPLIIYSSFDFRIKILFFIS